MRGTGWSILMVEDGIFCWPLTIPSIGIIAIALIVWIALRLATPIGAKVGVTGLNIATRVMGLLVAAIGVQMLTYGLAKLLPGLA